MSALLVCRICRRSHAVGALHVWTGPRLAVPEITPAVSGLTTIHTHNPSDIHLGEGRPEPVRQTPCQRCTQLDDDILALRSALTSYQQADDLHKGEVERLVTEIGTLQGKLKAQAAGKVRKAKTSRASKHRDGKIPATACAETK